MVRKTLFPLAILLGFQMQAQQGIAFEDKSFGEILAKAKKENKLVFVDAFAAWCGPCKQMEKNVFPQEKVRDYYNHNFVNARFDMEKGEGRTIAAKYGVRSYPTYLFINGEGEVVYKGMGYLEESQFLALGNEANSVGKGGSAKERFAQGEKDPEFLFNAIKLNANTDPEFAKKVSERYFQVRKPGDYSRDEVSMLLYFLKSANDPNYQVFLRDRNAIIKALPENVYDQFKLQVTLNAVVDKAVDHQKGTIDEALFLSEVGGFLGKTEAETALARLKLNFYPSVGNFSAFEQTALAYYREGEGIEPDELNRTAFIFAEHVTNPLSLKAATVWAEKSVMATETPENTYILAKLYAKTGKQQEALMYAERSVSLSKARGMDSAVQEALLNELSK
ncbi:thioredoxin family protein [Bergeyella sp. RCAD1439]|uniref:thioredoxin family protein n=1 Tax=Bergeyella anatis TaxID=3113737 RepID=UPI002E16C6A5|nr:thioredoxin fold domain-containing protein [Bergeyella sp. RCAD1439]